VLGAAVNSGTITWYDNLGGGTPIGTGSPFTTPFLNETQTFYVASVIPGTILETAGKPVPPGITSGNLNNYGLVFTADQYLQITSVDVYPAAAGGDLSIAL
jgi:hypothetical protein